MPNSAAIRALRQVANRRWAVPVALGLLALVLRLIWVESVQRVGLAFNDALMYHTTAISVSRGDGYAPLTGGPTARWPPGYSTVLGATYRVFGIDEVWGERLNAVIGAITVVLLFLAVERALDRTTATVASAILAVLPGAILWTDVLVSETLYTALFVLAVLVLTRARASLPWCAAIGAVIGLGALVRGEALTWVLLPVAMWWTTTERAVLVRRIASVVAIAALVMVPWTIRNAIVMDAFVPVATNASQTLWSGHNPDATGAQVYPPNGFEESFAPDLPERELLASSALRNDAIEFLFTHPLRELELIPLKLVHLHRGDSYALDWVNTAGFGEPLPITPLAAERIGTIADAAYYALLTLTVLGAIVLGGQFWRRPIGRLITTSGVTMLVLYGFVYYGNYRYRVPYQPLMAIVAAALLVRLSGLRRPESFAGAAEVEAEPDSTDHDSSP